MHTGFWWGKPEGKSHLEYPGVDRMIILKWIIRKWMDWIELAEDKDRWRALVKAIMILRLQYNAGNFLTR